MCQPPLWAKIVVVLLSADNSPIFKTIYGLKSGSIKIKALLMSRSVHLIKNENIINPSFLYFSAF